MFDSIAPNAQKGCERANPVYNLIQNKPLGKNDASHDQGSTSDKNKWYPHIHV